MSTTVLDTAETGQVGANGGAADSTAPQPASPADQRGPHKDVWDKLDVLLKPIGSILTACLAAYLGLLASDYLDRQQRLAASVDLYAQLMSSREAADSALRKEMFNTTLVAFLSATATSSPREKVIKLDLLARNFHNSLDLAPLFDHLFYELGTGKQQDSLLQRRLESLASQVNQQQLTALETVGARRDGAINLEEFPLGGMPLFEAVPLGFKGEPRHRVFRVEILRVDARQKRLRCRLIVRSVDGTDELDSVLDVGIFDFPMIRNVPLQGGARCALVVSKLRDFAAEITLIYFPGSRAALKEKPYYDEIFQQLVAHE